MKALFIIAAAVFLFTGFGLYHTFNSKITPPPVRVLNPTPFASLQEVGAVVFRRYWNEIQAKNLVIIGSSPYLRDYEKVWEGFLLAAQSSGVHFAVIFGEKNLKFPKNTNVQPLDWNAVNSQVNEQKKILVQVLSNEENLRQLQKKTPQSLLIIQSLLPVSDSAKVILQSHCLKKVAEYSVHCQALDSLKHGRKKKFDPDKITAVIEKIATGGELLLIHESNP